MFHVMEIIGYEEDTQSSHSGHLSSWKEHELLPIFGLKPPSKCVCVYICA